VSRLIVKAARAVDALARRRIAFDVDLIPFQWDDVPRRKVLNWLRTESSVYARPARPWGMPTLLQVEPTNRCNLHCRVCPVGTGLGRSVGDMAPALFERIVDEVRDYALLLLFWDWGEPFLHPDACDMIRYARQAGLRVVASTNGHVFAGPRHTERVVSSGLDVLVFSVDGITQETYQHYRAAGKLDEVIEGIRNVVEARRRAGAETPFVNLRFIVMRHNEHELPRLRDFAASLGVDALTLRKFHAVPDRRMRSRWAEADFVPTQREYQLPVLTPGTLEPMRTRSNPCRNLWNCPTLHWNGAVCSCFMDWSESRPLGVFGPQSLREIWYGEAYRDLRTRFRRNWSTAPLCGECALGYVGGDIGREANAEVFMLGRKTGAQQRR
jgi:MoaA/NifB/PqqE/SkfB family radical SAM enzyme